MTSAPPQLAGLAEALEATPELESFLQNPQLDPGSKADVLSADRGGRDRRAPVTSSGSSPARAARGSCA